MTKRKRRSVSRTPRSSKPRPKPRARTKRRGVPKAKPRPKAKPKRRPVARPKSKRPTSRKGRVGGAQTSSRRVAQPRPRTIKRSISRSPKRPAKRETPQRPAPIVKTPYPATWFLKDYQTGASRRGQLAYLRKTIQQLRSVYRGFTARDGFDARYPQNWSAKQHTQVMEYGARLHALMSAQHLIVRPRNKAEEKALRIHTQQHVARQKAFVIHTSDPLKARVHYSTQPSRLMPFFAPPIGGGLRVEMVREHQDGKLVLVDRDYLFQEMLGFQPYTWGQFLRALRMLLPLLPDKTPSGRDALYTLLSREHGPISAPVLKQFLIETLVEWSESYSNSFAGTLIGVRYQGDRWQAAMGPRSEYNQRQARRTLYKRIKQQDAAEARRLPRRRKKKKSTP